MEIIDVANTNHLSRCKSKKIKKSKIEKRWFNLVDLHVYTHNNKAFVSDGGVWKQRVITVILLKITLHHTVFSIDSFSNPLKSGGIFVVQWH